MIFGIKQFWTKDKRHFKLFTLSCFAGHHTYMFEWGTLNVSDHLNISVEIFFWSFELCFFANLNYYLAHLNNFCLIFNFFFGSFVELFNWAAVQYTIFGPPLISILYIFILYIISGLYTWVRLRHFLGRALWLGLARGPSLRPINMQDLALVYFATCTSCEIYRQEFSKNIFAFFTRAVHRRNLQDCEK